MSQIEQLESDFGFNIDIALDIDPGLFDTGESNEVSQSLAYWTMLYYGIASSPRYVAFARSSVRSWHGQDRDEHRFMNGNVCVYQGLQPDDINFVAAAGDDRAKAIVSSPHRRFEFAGSLAAENSEAPLVLAIAARQQSETEVAAATPVYRLEKPSTYFGDLPDVAITSLNKTLAATRLTSGGNFAKLAGAIFDWEEGERYRLMDLQFPSLITEEMSRH